MEINFNNLPEAVAALSDKIDRLLSLQQNASSEHSVNWMTLEQTCAYIPGKPAKSTVYGLVSERGIPYHKKGKRLIFLKSEIDAWIIDGRRQTATEIKAQNYMR